MFILFRGEYYISEVIVLHLMGKRYLRMTWGGRECASVRKWGATVYFQTVLKNVCPPRQSVQECPWCDREMWAQQRWGGEPWIILCTREEKQRERERQWKRKGERQHGVYHWSFPKAHHQSDAWIFHTHTHTQSKGLDTQPAQSWRRERGRAKMLKHRDITFNYTPHISAYSSAGSLEIDTLLDWLS